MKKTKEWTSEVEKSIEVSIPAVKKDSMMPNQSSYVFRPDFIIEEGDKRFVIEIKNREIGSRDLALFKGIVSGTYTQPIFILPEEPKKETSNIAKELGIKIITGSPENVSMKLKEIIKEE